VFQKKLNLALTLGLLVVSFAAWLLSVTVERSLQENLAKNVSGIDMVVGAKGSPMQLLLSSVLFSDSPTGNISIEEYNALKENPLVKSTIPIAQGDNYKGFPIVGTNQDFLTHYQASLQSGDAAFETGILLGYSVSQTLDLHIGDMVQATHGSGEGKSHNHGLKVVGILKANNSVLDKLILTSIANIHANHANVHGADEEITAAWIKFKSPLAMMQLPRMVNKNTNMQAALPAIEMNRILKLSGGGIAIIKLFSGIFLLLALYSILVHMYNSVSLHLKDLALLRMYGYAYSDLFGLLISEAFVITSLGAVLSIVFSKAAFVLLNQFAKAQFRMPLLTVEYFNMFDAMVLTFGIGTGVLASILPIVKLKRSHLISFLR
jgi:putative ABC transport system permease protein